MKVADEIWVATALLHLENPSREDFSVDEILKRIRKEKFSDTLRPGVRTHLASHCVANKPSHIGSPTRILLETTRGRRRLFRPGDPFDEERARGRMVPRKEDLPPRFAFLLDWYEHNYKDSPNISKGSGTPGKELLRFAGTISKEDADLMLKAIEEGCEQVYESEW